MPPHAKSNHGRRRPVQPPHLPRVAGRQQQGIRPPAPPTPAKPEEESSTETTDSTDSAPKPPRNWWWVAIAAAAFAGWLVYYLANEAGKVAAFIRAYTPCMHPVDANDNPLPAPVNDSVCKSNGVSQQSILFNLNFIVITLMTACVLFAFLGYALRWYRGKRETWPKPLTLADKLLTKANRREKAVQLADKIYYAPTKLQWAIFAVSGLALLVIINLLVA